MYHIQLLVLSVQSFASAVFICNHNLSDLEDGNTPTTNVLRKKSKGILCLSLPFLELSYGLRNDFFPYIVLMSVILLGSDPVYS